MAKVLRTQRIVLILRKWRRLPQNATRVPGTSEYTYTFSSLPARCLLLAARRTPHAASRKPQVARRTPHAASSLTHACTGAPSASRPSYKRRGDQGSYIPVGERTPCPGPPPLGGSLHLPTASASSGLSAV